MSDEFFNKLFGDSESTQMGSGWFSGTAAVFFGMLSLGGVLTLHLPAQLTTFAILLPATMASKWLAIPVLMQTVGGLPFLV